LKPFGIADLAASTALDAATSAIAQQNLKYEESKNDTET
jgi:hypothetical protein